MCREAVVAEGCPEVKDIGVALGHAEANSEDSEALEIKLKATKLLEDYKKKQQMFKNDCHRVSETSLVPIRSPRNRAQRENERCETGAGSFGS